MPREMSRCRAEFEHRPTIVKGAFRAWSHLGGETPCDLPTKTTAALDPLTFPLADNAWLLATTKKGKKKGAKTHNDNAGAAGDGDPAEDRVSGGPPADPGRYPQEPLPCSGLSHPFVQAVLYLWLGPNNDQDVIQLDLTMLWTW